ncbi:glycoside hydrolase family 114 protein [Lentithecium fluviatile CBS 122367]|uniref:alpha-galactosidase n=1 Tax=Lentithecium fluviatile CBS 122367 TaxID=1168545 RepID=A0A6G1JP13_9PLEO|nr:glycoside hydrolase family 114 protein [Lentithecium fluviatile CBS 122367]
MHLPTALALAGIAAAHPFSPSSFSRRAVPTIPNTSTFDILLAGNLNGDTGTFDENVQVMILDMEGNDASTIQSLVSSGVTVLCYFSAGTYEPNRSDSAKFLDADLGNTMEDWPDEKWLDVESENVRTIMKGRIQMAKDKGCMGVDPDNVDGYQPDNNDGFGKPASAHASYVKFLASEAASLDLAIGLKNALDLIPDVVDVVQFAVNEQCHEYSECDAYKPFSDAGKAVFNIEYGGQCGAVEGVTLSTVLKSLDLNELGGQCAASGVAASGAATATGVSAPVTTKPVATATTTTTGVAKPSTSVTPSSSTAATTPSPTAPAEEEEEGDEDEEAGDEDDEEEEPSRPHYHGHRHNRTRGYKEY